MTCCEISTCYLAAPEAYTCSLFAFAWPAQRGTWRQTMNLSDVLWGPDQEIKLPLHRSRISSLRPTSLPSYLRHSGCVLCPCCIVQCSACFAVDISREGGSPFSPFAAPSILRRCRSVHEALTRSLMCCWPSSCRRWGSSSSMAFRWVHSISGSTN